MLEPADRRASEDRLRQIVRNCDSCPLSNSRTQVVFGEGALEAKLMMIGEAPGAREDAEGIPFIGRSGQLLTLLLARSGIAREDVFITNLVKCRPPENRDPTADEISQCSSWLADQIEIIRPRFIASLGNHSTQFLSGSKLGIMSVHGQVQTVDFGAQQITLFPLIHPAAALRSTKTRELLEQDLVALAQLIAGTGE